MTRLPAARLYEKYGNPYRLVEFRVFSFNRCGAGCANCFYQKADNHFEEFHKVRELATDLEKNGYQLETCYLLPTDVFENDFNYRIFSDDDLTRALRMFRFIGLASTLRNGFDSRFLDELAGRFPAQSFELHVNLLEDRVDESGYLAFLGEQLRSIRSRYGERIHVNLAINTGSRLADGQMEAIAGLAGRLSEDRILELNFTYLFNRRFTDSARRKYLENSFPLIRFLLNKMSRSERKFTDRTLLRKPSFVFKDGGIFLAPILPFDEYLFIEHPEFKLGSPTFDAFLRTYCTLEEQNIPILADCERCPHLSTCSGKGYFMAARRLGTGCFLQESTT